MTNEEKIEKAKLYATMVMQTTSLAELFLKDYERILLDLRFSTKQDVKQKVSMNAEKASQLGTGLRTIEKALTGIMNEAQHDSFLDDVGFLHNLIISSYEMCYDSEPRRAKILEKINGAYKTKLKEIR